MCAFYNVEKQKNKELSGIYAPDFVCNIAAAKPSLYHHIVKLYI